MATVTMLPSRIVIKVPAHSTTRDAQREYVRADGRVRDVFDSDPVSAVMAV